MKAAAVPKPDAKLFADGLSFDKERAALEELCKENPAMAPSLALMCLNDKHRFQAAAAEFEAELVKMRKLIEEPPWIPAIFVRLLDGGARAEIASGRGRIAVPVAPGVDPAELHTGRAVFLNNTMNLVVALACANQFHHGPVGAFSRMHDQRRAVLHAANDDEIVVDLAEQLLEEKLVNGDLLLYDPEARIAFERVTSRHKEASLLEPLLSDKTIDQLGGLDDVFYHILDEVALQLLYPDVARRYQVNGPRSAILEGPPGVGKTTLAGCIANELTRVAGVPVRAFLMPPSIHRSKWYGEAEERIRRIRREVEDSVAGGAYTIVVLDDADHIGSRDTHNDVDARVLPAFLEMIEALCAMDRVFLIACTNRADLLDEALVRAGRLGNRRFAIPRPASRPAVRAVLDCYLKPDLPYAANGHRGAEAAGAVREDALSAIFAPNGEFASLAMLHLRDGSTRPVTPSMLMSGALVKNIVDRAKSAGAIRDARGGAAGISTDDLIAAIDAQFEESVQGLRPGPGLRAMLDLPHDLDVLKVEFPRRRRKARNRRFVAAKAS